MGSVVAVAGVVAGWAIPAAGFVWLAARAKRGRGGGGVIGVFDEVYYPIGHEARIQVEQRVERKDPAPSPDDPPGDLSSRHR